MRKALERKRKKERKKEKRDINMKFVGSIASLLLGASLSLPSSIYAFQAPSLLSRNGGSRRTHQDGGERLRLSSTLAKKPGTAELDTPWEELGFEFRPTNSHVRITCKDGEWGEPELVKVRFFLKTNNNGKKGNA